MMRAAQPWLFHTQASYKLMYANGSPHGEPCDKVVNIELLQTLLGMASYSSGAVCKSQPMPRMHSAPPLLVFSLQVDCQFQPRSHSAPESHTEIQSIPAPDCQPEPWSRSVPPSQPSLQPRSRSHSAPGVRNEIQSIPCPDCQLMSRSASAPPSQLLLQHHSSPDNGLFLQGDILPRNHPLVQDHPDLILPSTSEFSLPSERFHALDLNFPSVSDVVDPSISQNTLVIQGQPTPIGAQNQPWQKTQVSESQPAPLARSGFTRAQHQRTPRQTGYASSSTPATQFDVEDPAAAPPVGL
ncbi:hypothetical protein DPSP01_005429 [Paraphaeosphaeria sporulosa]